MGGRPDKLATLAYHPSKRLLAAGTKEGRVVVWKHHGGAPRDAPEKVPPERLQSLGPPHRATLDPPALAPFAQGWAALPAVDLDGPPSAMAWSTSESVLAVCSSTGLSLLPETVKSAPARRSCGL